MMQFGIVKFGIQRKCRDRSKDNKGKAINVACLVKSFELAEV